MTLTESEIEFIEQLVRQLSVSAAQPDALKVVQAVHDILFKLDQMKKELKNGNN